MHIPIINLFLFIGVYHVGSISLDHEQGFAQSSRSFSQHLLRWRGGGGVGSRDCSAGAMMILVVLMIMIWLCYGSGNGARIADGNSGDGEDGDDFGSGGDDLVVSMAGGGVI